MRWGRPSPDGASGGELHRRAGTQGADPPEATEAPPVRIESAERIVTLTDGVVAIAMTLLVFDLSSVNYHGSSAAGLHS